MMALAPLSSVGYAASPAKTWVSPGYDSDTPGFGMTHFQKIQEAVNAVADQGTVWVGEGVYNEMVFVNKPGLRLTAEEGAVLEEDQQATTSKEITPAGFPSGFHVSAEGVTIEEFTIQNYSGAGIYLEELGNNTTIQKNRILHNNFDGIRSHSDNNLIEQNIIQGSQYTGIYATGSSNTIADNQLEDYGEVGIFIEGPQESSHIVKDNHLDGGQKAFAGIIVDGTADSLLCSNTVQHHLYYGVGLAGGRSLLRQNQITHSGIWGLLVFHTSLDAKTQADPPGGDDLNRIEDNLIAQNGGKEVMVPKSLDTFETFAIEEEGGGILTTEGNLFRRNAIYGNEGHGLYVESMKMRATDLPEEEVKIDAVLNWWGHTSGPYQASTNPYGLGDRVCDRVDYSPWLLAPPDAADPSATKTDSLSEGETLAIEDAVSTEVIQGSGTVTVGQYLENPVPASLLGSVGMYVDVYITSPHDIDELQIKLFYENSFEKEEDFVLHWWDGSDWIPCSDSEVNSEGLYVSARITADSIPALDDLTNTVFAAGLIETEEEPFEDEPEEEPKEEPEEELPKTGGFPYTGLGLIIASAGLLMKNKKSRFLFRP